MNTTGSTTQLTASSQKLGTTTRSSGDAFRELISGEQTGIPAGVLRTTLRVLSWFYGIAIWLRNRAFDVGLCSTARVSVPVISIGNITTGGTGKTPVVAWLVRCLSELGRKPGIVSRGYHADQSGHNDEYRVLELLCPNVPHIQNKNRAQSAIRLVTESAVNVIVMDDGFQHRRLARDLDIVLIDALNPFGFNAILPRGLLREPLSSLRRASLILITRCDSVAPDQLQVIRRKVLELTCLPPDKLFEVAFVPAALVNTTGDRRSVNDVSGKSAFLMCGIGNPEAFTKTCLSMGVQIVGSRTFPDHHHYSESDITSVVSEFDNSGAELLLTTQKDLVKLPRSATFFSAVELSVSVTNHSDLSGQKVGSSSETGIGGTSAAADSGPLSAEKQFLQILQQILDC
ncbi:MAG: tetraacyldisaccharide 4'-kinase [Planctomyces sp.]